VFSPPRAADETLRCGLCRFSSGISWFGVEGKGSTFTGLNYTTIDTVLDWVIQQHYNTLRIPFSVAFALEPELHPRPEYVSRELRGRSAWEILDVVVRQQSRVAAAARIIS
jgi:aryl-phospho-beta-D-glucosidase BglC (GH1 family)